MVYQRCVDLIVFPAVRWGCLRCCKMNVQGLKHDFQGLRGGKTDPGAAEYFHAVFSYCLGAYGLSERSVSKLKKVS